MAFAKLEVRLPFFVAFSVVFARYSDFRYLVVWVCIPGLVNGTAYRYRVSATGPGALRAPDFPEPF